MDLEELKEIAEKVKSGKNVYGTTRQLLRYCGYHRRGSWINGQIRKELDKLGITTFPPFDTTWVDEEFAYKVKEQIPEKSEPVDDKQGTITSVIDQDIEFLRDPTFRVGRLESANQKPLSVNSNSNLTEATTQMLMNDYSQLPVIDGNTLKGMISWKSIGSRLAPKHGGTEVRHFMEKAYEISADESIFRAIELVKQYDAVLVRNKGKLSGIITTYDLSTQFRQLAEPFLLLSEIENQIRILLEGQLTNDELKKVKDPNDPEREITCISDLTFGEYVKIFQNPDYWGKLKLEIDRNSFTQKLDNIRKIRNDVMHFDPDPLDDKDLQDLRNFSIFLDRLVRDKPTSEAQSNG